MRHRLTAAMAFALLAFVAAAQESDSEPQEPDATTEEAEVEETPDLIDESGLDAQGFEASDDDDFVPTEDIPTDQSIPFPTDI